VPFPQPGGPEKGWLMEMEWVEKRRLERAARCLSSLASRCAHTAPAPLRLHARRQARPSLHPAAQSARGLGLPATSHARTRSRASRNRAVALSLSSLSPMRMTRFSGLVAHSRRRSISATRAWVSTSERSGAADILSEGRACGKNDWKVRSEREEKTRPAPARLTRRSRSRLSARLSKQTKNRARTVTEQKTQ